MNIKIILSLLAIGVFSSHSLFSMNQDGGLFEEIIKTEKECGPYRKELAGKRFENDRSITELTVPYRVIKYRFIKKGERKALENFPRLNEFLINNLPNVIIPAGVEPEKLHLIARAFLFTHDIKKAATLFDNELSCYENTTEYERCIFDISVCLLAYKQSTNNIADKESFNALFSKIEELSKGYETESF